MKWRRSGRDFCWLDNLPIGIGLIVCVLFVVRVSVADSPRLNGELAFVRLTEGFWQVWQVDLESGQERQRTFGAFDKRYPRWASTGTLYFRSNNDELYRIKQDAKVEAPYRVDLWPSIDPAPSPHSEPGDLVFVRMRSDLSDASAIYRLTDKSSPGQSLDDGEAPLRLLTVGPGLRIHPTWTPDGTGVAFVRTRGPIRSDIRHVASDGGEVTDLVVGEHRNLHPAYSPDGDLLVYVSNRSGDYEIWIKPLDSSGSATERRLTNHHGIDTRPVWSPDGRSIAFSSYRDDGFELWVMNRDGSDPRQLVSRNRGEARDPAWR